MFVIFIISLLSYHNPHILLSCYHHRIIMLLSCHPYWGVLLQISTYISLNHYILGWHWTLLATGRWFWPPLLRSHPWLCHMIQKTGKTLGYIGCEGHDAVDIWSEMISTPIQWQKALFGPVKNGELRWCSRIKLDSRSCCSPYCWYWDAGIHVYSFSVGLVLCQSFGHKHVQANISKHDGPVGLHVFWRMTQEQLASFKPRTTLRIDLYTVSGKSSLWNRKTIWTSFIRSYSVPWQWGSMSNSLHIWCVPVE